MTSFPVALPSSPGPETVKLSPINKVAVSRSDFSGKARSFAWAGGQLWQITFSYSALGRGKGAPFQAWALLLQGSYGNFTAGDPAATTPRGIGTGTPLTNGVATAGAATLVTDGWTISQTGILKAGDYLQIGTDLYMVMADANSDGSGNATFTIWPFVRRAYADNTTIIVNNTVGIFKLTTDVEFDLSVATIYGFSFTAIEDVQ